MRPWRRLRHLLARALRGGPTRGRTAERTSPRAPEEATPSPADREFDAGVAKVLRGPWDAQG